jgi:acyl-CoA dehydrogenase
MDFTFSPEQKSLGNIVGQVLSRFPGLTSPNHDREADGAVWQALSEIGLFALLVPEAYGGVGLTLVDLALAIEHLGGALASTLITHTLVATDLIVRFAKPEHKDLLLPAIAAGSLRVALATHEAGCSTGSSHCRTLIESGRLTGCKINVPGAGSADWFLVAASSGGRPLLALVPREAEGVGLRGHDSLDPSSDFSEVDFDTAASSNSGVILLGEAEAATTRLFNAAAALYAALQTGMAARMLEASVQYARTRVQFGQKIGAFQTIKHRCADMAVALDVGQTAAYYAFWALSENAPDAGRASSMAKAYCGEIARSACNEAIQIHGGMGFTWELGLHRFLRRAKLLDQCFGNQEWHYENVMKTTLVTQAGTGKR